MITRRIRALPATLAAAVALSGGAAAAGIEAAIGDVIEGHAASRDVQIEIDRLSGVDRGASRTLADRRLAAEVRRAEAGIGALNGQIAEARAAIRGLQEAEAGLIPLLHSMLDVLERSIDLDLPLDVAARRAAVADARRALTDHELSAADRYGRVLGAYLAEVRRGYDSERAQRTLSLDGQERALTVLRIGRLALYYVSADGEECGLWLPAAARFTRLADHDCARLADAGDSDRHADLLSVLPLPGEAP